MKPVVSINLCCYNSEKYLKETLQSIIDQTYKNWELVIVNDGSTDRTESIISEFRDQGYPIVYHFQQNRGLQASRNKAVELSQGDFISFMDHDDLWMPEMLERQLSAFDSDTILVYGNYITKNMLTGREYMSFDPDREFHSGWVAEKLFKKNFIFLESVVVRAEAVRKLGEAFDVQLRVADDIDFLQRLSLIGPFKYTTYVTCLYRMHPDNLTTSKKHYFVHDFSYMLKKYRGKVPDRLLKDLARQYVLTVRVDLYHSGYKLFPFFRLGFNLKQVLVAMVLPFFGDKDILEVKADIMRPFRYLSSLFVRRSKSS